MLSLGNANKQGWVSGDERPTAAQLEHDAYMGCYRAMGKLES